MPREADAAMCEDGGLIYSLDAIDPPRKSALVQQWPDML